MGKPAPKAHQLDYEPGSPPRSRDFGTINISATVDHPDQATDILFVAARHRAPQGTALM